MYATFSDLQIHKYAKQFDRLVSMNEVYERSNGKEWASFVHLPHPLHSVAMAKQMTLLIIVSLTCDCINVLLWNQADVRFHADNDFSVNVDEQHSNRIYDDSNSPSSACTTDEN